MASPYLGLTELAQGQAIPETNVNERGRWWEFFACGGGIEDRDTLDPTALTPSDGDAYLIDGTGAGDWADHDGEIAMYLNTAWAFVAPLEGMQLYVNDEDARIIYDGATWNSPASSGGGADDLALAPTWDFNFTDDADAYIRAPVAMTVTEQDTSGTGTIAYEKSTAAAPDTFSSTTSPITLEAGAKLKVSASSITGSVAVHLERTA